MNKGNQIGVNIRSLRKAYGETQEQLGQAIGGYEKNSVSYFENGKREPNQDVLARIATHYLVSLDELINSDLSSIGTIKVDKYALWKNVDIVFPIVSSEQALKNDQFRSAYGKHRALYSEFHQVNLNGIDKIDEIIDGYFDAMDVEEIEAEAAVNFLALWFLIMGIVEIAPAFLTIRPAALLQITSNDEKARKIVENTDASFFVDAKELREEFDSNEMIEIQTEMLTTVKRSDRWSDIADYYLALRYIWNLVDNDLDLCSNSRIGIEMMTSFAMVDNPYAARFLRYSLDSAGRKSSQSVDDK